MCTAFPFFFSFFFFFFFFKIREVMLDFDLEIMYNSCVCIFKSLTSMENYYIYAPPSLTIAFFFSPENTDLKRQFSRIKFPYIFTNQIVRKQKAYMLSGDGMKREKTTHISLFTIILNHKKNPLYSSTCNIYSMCWKITYSAFLSIQVRILNVFTKIFGGWNLEAVNWLKIKWIKWWW